MPATPYPPFSPHLKTVEIVGDYNRTCLVLELCTLRPLGTVKLAQIEDAIAMTLSKFVEIGKADVVHAHRFTAPLSTALHLPRGTF